MGSRLWWLAWLALEAAEVWGAQRIRHSCSSDADCASSWPWPRRCCTTLACNDRLGYFLVSSGCLAVPNVRRACPKLGSFTPPHQIAARLHIADWLPMEASQGLSCRAVAPLVSSLLSASVSSIDGGPRPLPRPTGPSPRSRPLPPPPSPPEGAGVFVRSRSFTPSPTRRRDRLPRRPTTRRPTTRRPTPRPSPRPTTSTTSTTTVAPQSPPTTTKAVVDSLDPTCPNVRDLCTALGRPCCISIKCIDIRHGSRQGEHTKKVGQHCDRRCDLRLTEDRHIMGYTYDFTFPAELWARKFESYVEGNLGTSPLYDCNELRYFYFHLQDAQED